jgi:hypothetical protein
MPLRKSPRFQNHKPGDSINGSATGIESSNGLQLSINIHAPGTWIGCKGYKGVLDTGETVFAKLWDGWKHSSEEADRETQIYVELRDLWGTVVPKMIAHGGWGFCHIVLLSFVEVYLNVFTADTCRAPVYQTAWLTVSLKQT